MDKEHCEEIATLVRDLWPQWKPGSKEIQVWIQVLYPYDYEPTSVAVKAVYAEQTRFTIRPPLGKIREKIRAIHPKREKQQTDPVLHYTIKCISHDSLPKLVGTKHTFWANSEKNLPDEDVGKQWAESARHKFEIQKGGRWITIWANNKRQEIEKLTKSQEAKDG